MLGTPWGVGVSHDKDITGSDGSEGPPKEQALEGGSRKVTRFGEEGYDCSVHVSLACSHTTRVSFTCGVQRVHCQFCARAIHSTTQRIL
eukprot:939578-Amphidinium_carterae.1